MNRSFDRAFEKLVDQRIDDIYRNKDISNQVESLIAEIEQKFTVILADVDEKEIKQVVEAMRDSYFNHNHSLFSKMYTLGFYDGLYLDKHLKRGGDCEGTV